MRGWTNPLVLLGSVLLVLVVACDEEASEDVAANSGPLLGALELPVSLRRSDSPPGDAVLLEVSTAEVRVAAAPVLTLTSGQIADADLSKLGPAIKATGRSVATLEVHASVPYRTLAQVLNAAQTAGVKRVAFKVRGNGGPEQLGYLAVDFTVGPTSKDDAAAEGVPTRPWSDFVSVWEDVENGCRGSDSGSCAYKPELVAEGGELKTVLYAAGDGVNINLYRVGPPPEVPVAKKPVEKLEGVPTDPAAEAEAQEPATEALFQFRAREATKDPSAVTATLAPLCKAKPCAFVVRAEAKTMTARVLSLLGAAMPDGSGAAPVRFEE